MLQFRSLQLPPPLIRRELDLLPALAKRGGGEPLNHLFELLMQKKFPNEDRVLT